MSAGLPLREEDLEASRPDNTNACKICFYTLMPQKIYKLTYHAVSILMTRKSDRRKQDPADLPPASMSSEPRREELGAYIAHPETYPRDIVVYYNEDFVAIFDKYPKSSLHLLLLPRDPYRTRLHPAIALEDTEFLAKVKPEADRLRNFAAEELRRRYGKDSAKESVRREALMVEPPADELPAGRDWGREIICGIHAHPSMNNLHIHVISVDRHSDRMKNRTHYNSFSTPFFVRLEEFPLGAEEGRRRISRSGNYLSEDLVCWRCHRNFGNKFAELKRHLDQEFDSWKKL